MRLLVIPHRLTLRLHACTQPSDPQPAVPQLLISCSHALQRLQPPSPSRCGPCAGQQAPPQPCQGLWPGHQRPRDVTSSPGAGDGRRRAQRCRHLRHQQRPRLHMNGSNIHCLPAVVMAAVTTDCMNRHCCRKGLLSPPRPPAAGPWVKAVAGGGGRSTTHPQGRQALSWRQTLPPPPQPPQAATRLHRR